MIIAMSQPNSTVTLNLFQGLTPVTMEIKMLKQVQHDEAGEAQHDEAREVQHDEVGEVK